MNKRKIINSVIDIIFVVCIGIIYFEWASHLMQSWAPDEGMREDVVYWIAKNGRLPIERTYKSNLGVFICVFTISSVDYRSFLCKDN